jgi:hypothetical protein
MHSFKTLDNKEFKYDVILAKGYNIAVANLHEFPHENSMWSTQTRYGISLWTSIFSDQRAFADDVSIYFAKREAGASDAEDAIFFLIVAESVGKGNYEFKIKGVRSNAKELFVPFSTDVDAKWQMANNPYSVAELLRERIETFDAIAKKKGAAVIELNIESDVTAGYMLMNVKRDARDKALDVKMKDELKVLFEFVTAKSHSLL